MQADSILAGKYRLLSQIGRGGMGSVWKAEHLDLRAPVAIKLMDPALADGLESAGRFLREARSAAALRSPHVVQILDYGVDEKTQIPFIAMELMEGESLAARLKRVQQLSPVETARIITHVARALTRAHEAGIIHRDLKPDNIFLVRNEDEEIAKVLDFGIAKSMAPMLRSHPATQPGSVLGTPYYMSPEQISGSEEVDHQTDLWAVAVIAYECLSGRRPFESNTPAGLAVQISTRRAPLASTFAAVPRDFDAWFDRATERDPSRRFGSARELADEFRRVCDSVVVRAVSSSDGQRGGLSTHSQSTEGIQPLSHTTPEFRRTRPARRWPLGVGLSTTFVVAAWASTTLFKGAHPSAATTSLRSAATAAISSGTPAIGPAMNGSPVEAPAWAEAADAGTVPTLPLDTPKQAPPRRIDTSRPSRSPSSDRKTDRGSDTASKPTVPPASSVPPPPPRTDNSEESGGILEDRK